jgi:type III pantothenate kinase
MNTSHASQLVAVDVGNTRIKIGCFDSPPGDGLPEPSCTVELPSRDWNPAEIEAVLADSGSLPRTWRMASVYRDASQRLAGWVRTNWASDTIREISSANLPLEVALDHPERVGIDRLLGAVAANHIRQAGRAAIVVDLGSAITVDLVNPAGVFAGGVIMPGVGMSARALHQQTALLPHDPMHRLQAPPDVLGTSTTDAIRSGLFWGAVGAIREVIARLSADLDAEPQVFLTGGAAPAVADLLGSEVRYAAHLVLSGIAIAHGAEIS